MDALHRRLAAQIREHARRRKIPLSHLPARAGVSDSHFWEVLAGRASPSLAWIGRIAAALDAEVVDLLERPATSVGRR